MLLLSAWLSGSAVHSKSPGRSVSFRYLTAGSVLTTMDNAPPFESADTLALCELCRFIALTFEVNITNGEC